MSVLPAAWRAFGLFRLGNLVLVDAEAECRVGRAETDVRGCEQDHADQSGHPTAATQGADDQQDGDTVCEVGATTRAIGASSVILT